MVLQIIKSLIKLMGLIAVVYILLRHRHSTEFASLLSASPLYAIAKRGSYTWKFRLYEETRPIAHERA